jgi:hypothetical protein
MRAVVTLALVSCGVVMADEPRTVTAGMHPVHLAFSPDGKLLAVGRYSGVIDIVTRQPSRG